MEQCIVNRDGDTIKKIDTRLSVKRIDPIEPRIRPDKTSLLVSFRELSRISIVRRANEPDTPQ